MSLSLSSHALKVGRQGHKTQQNCLASKLTNSIGWKLLRITNTNKNGRMRHATKSSTSRQLVGNLATFAMKLVTMMTLKG